VGTGGLLDAWRVHPAVREAQGIVLALAPAAGIFGGLLARTVRVAVQVSMECGPEIRDALPLTFAMIDVTSTASMKMSQRSRSREDDQRSYLEARGDDPMAHHNA